MGRGPLARTPLEVSSRPEEIRARLVELPAGTDLLRNVRYMHAEDFDDCTTEELVRGARWLRAASYSAAEGARKLDAIARKRTTTTTTEETGPSTCTSDPATTATSTSTEEPPTATPPPPAPK